MPLRERVPCNFVRHDWPSHQTTDRHSPFYPSRSRRVTRHLLSQRILLRAFPSQSLCALPDHLLLQTPIVQCNGTQVQLHHLTWPPLYTDYTRTLHVECNVRVLLYCIATRNSFYLLPGLNRAPQVLLSSHRATPRQLRLLAPLSPAHRPLLLVRVSRPPASSSGARRNRSSIRNPRAAAALMQCQSATRSSVCRRVRSRRKATSSRRQQSSLARRCVRGPRGASPTPRRWSPLHSRASLSAFAAAALLERVASVPAVQVLLLSSRSPRDVLPPLCSALLTRPSLLLLVARNGWATPRSLSECVRRVSVLPFPSPSLPPRLHASSAARSAHCSAARTRSPTRCRCSALCRARLVRSFRQSCSSPSASRSPLRLKVDACGATRARGAAVQLSRQHSSRLPRRLRHLYQLLFLIAPMSLHQLPPGPIAVGNSYSVARGVLLQVQSQSLRPLRLLVVSVARLATCLLLSYVYSCRGFLLLQLQLRVVGYLYCRLASSIVNLVKYGRRGAMSARCASARRAESARALAAARGGR